MVGQHERLLTPKQLSELLQVPESTLRRWRTEGRGPVVTWMNSRRARYQRADVDRWLAEQKAAGQETARVARGAS